jgi:hypothetical protein
MTNKTPFLFFVVPIFLLLVGAPAPASGASQLAIETEQEQPPMTFSVRTLVPVDALNVSVSNGELGSITGSGTNWTVVAVPLAFGVVTVRVSADVGGGLQTVSTDVAYSPLYEGGYGTWTDFDVVGLPISMVRSRSGVSD